MITTIKSHKVQHSDVMNGISELMGNEKAEIFYSDPPCCGMGFSAQIACDNKMMFRGNELNSKRLEKTKLRLAK